MAKKNWLAICTIAGGVLGGALGAVTQDIFGGVFGGLLLGGAIGLFVRGKTLPPRPQGAGVARTSVHDPFPAHIGIGAAGLAAHQAHGQDADASCAIDNGAGDAGGGGDCGGGDSGGGGN